MDRELHSRLVSLLLSVPDMEDYKARSNLLAGIPNSLRLALPRSHSNAHTDISGLVTELAERRLLDGRWTILMFIDNALPSLEETMEGKQLAELRLQIEASLQQKKPYAPSSTPPAAKKTSGGGFPHGYAVIVGIAEYSDTRLRLSEAIVKDAMDMHTTLKDANSCGYANDHVRLRYDAQATAETICKDLEWLKEVTAKDEEATAIFYFSGHGGRIEIDEQVTHYLLPVDCNLNKLSSTAITDTKLAQLLSDIRSQRLLVLLDSCYSGGMDEIKGPSGKESMLKYGPEKEEDYQQLAQEKGRVIIASSSPNETSRSASALNNSLFTHYLLKALRGEVASLSLGDGLIRVLDLFSYVSRQVPIDRPQHPVMTASKTSNFPIALYRGGMKK
jgi:metacaspase-1